MSKRTLLLADDSVTIQKVVNLTFADEGINVITVGDGDAAIKQITESRPDVVLADVHMPGLTGYQICEMLRGNPETRELPVVLLVGSFEPFDENEAARVGANAFLTKPFQSIRQLVSQVSDLMEISTARMFEQSGQVQEPEQPAPYEPAEEPADPATFVTEEVKVVDTSDIDSLYKRSFGGPSEVPEGESGPPRYVDAGMDDEMIETVHTGSEDDPSLETGFSYEPATPSESGFSQGDNEFSPASEEVAPANLPDAHMDVPRFDEAAPEEPVSEAAAQEEAIPERYDSDAAHYGSAQEETAASEQDDVAASGTEQETAGSGFETAPETQDESDFDQFAATEQIPTTFEISDPNLVPQSTARPTQENFRLDDIDILDLPPIDNAEQGSGKQVVSLSPELMESIVKKVVEKLSEK